MFGLRARSGLVSRQGKKITVPEDIKGMKIRPAHATMASFVTQLGGTNVQAAAPEVRDILEKGVADAVTFPGARCRCSGSTKSPNTIWTFHST